MRTAPELSEVQAKSRLEGFKNQIEIKQLLSENHLFLMTSSVDEFNRREAFGIVSLEAQSMGLPVVGFKSGGFPETLVEGKTGFTVEDNNCFEMSIIIQRLIEDSELLSKVGKMAIKNVKQNFDLSYTNKLFINLYKSKF